VLGAVAIEALHADGKPCVIGRCGDAAHAAQADVVFDGIGDGLGHAAFLLQGGPDCGAFQRAAAGTISTVGSFTCITVGDSAAEERSTAWWLWLSAAIQHTVSTTPTAAATAKRASAGTSGCGAAVSWAAAIMSVPLSFGDLAGPLEPNVGS